MYDSDADDENEEEDEEDSPQPAVARADPLPGGRTVRRRVGPTRGESRAEPVEERPTMEEPETEDAGVLFDPAEMFEDAAAKPVPESQDESLSPVEQSLLSQFGDVPKCGTKGYDDFRAFSAIRMETPEAIKWLKRGALAVTRTKPLKVRCSLTKSAHQSCRRESMDPGKSIGKIGSSSMRP